MSSGQRSAPHKYLQQSSCANKVLDGVLTAENLARYEPAVEQKAVIKSADWDKIQDGFEDMILMMPAG